MPKIINVPIEPLEERYSKQWATWWPREFEKLGIDYYDVKGEVLTDTIEQGAFLDVIGTNYYKASQLKKIMKRIYDGDVEPGDTFLFMDLWFPGIEMLAYVRDALDMDFNITGILHAGTYDPHDFISKAGMGIWGKLLEESWFRFVDEIYVATEFHKELICSVRRINQDRIKVTGLPIFDEQTKSNTIIDQVVFPHRLDAEKDPETFYWLEERMNYNRQTEDETYYRFLATKKVWTDKKNYFKQLSESKVTVSCAHQETWGIAMIESVFAGCIPLVPARLSYKEMYLPEFRYSNKDELFNMCRKYLLNYDNIEIQALLAKQQTMLREAGSQAIPNIVRCIEALA